MDVNEPVLGTSIVALIVAGAARLVLPLMPVLQERLKTMITGKKSESVKPPPAAPPGPPAPATLPVDLQLLAREVEALRLRQDLGDTQEALRHLRRRMDDSVLERSKLVSELEATLKHNEQLLKEMAELRRADAPRGVRQELRREGTHIAARPGPGGVERPFARPAERPRKHLPDDDEEGG